MGGAPSSRQQRVGDLLRAEISEIVQMKMRDPRLGFLTVTGVEVSRDLRHASVFVSVLGKEEDGSTALDTLNKASGFVRSELGHRVELKHTPELHFVIDKSLERSMRISEVLKKILDEPPQEGS
jgi:ribosome-binding factor A